MKPENSSIRLFRALLLPPKGSVTVTHDVLGRTIVTLCFWILFGMALFINGPRALFQAWKSLDSNQEGAIRWFVTAVINMVFGVLGAR
jgi:hypothetical protein